MSIYQDDSPLVFLPKRDFQGQKYALTPVEITKKKRVFDQISLF